MFQFHTGSIKSLRVLDSHKHDTRFNSILVRLKDLQGDSILMRNLKFQFHTGSIKSWARVDVSDWISAFQFHTGSIKSFPM